MPSAGSAPVQTSAHTTLQTETSLSALYHVIKTIMKLLRPRLAKAGSPLPGGSPRLSDYPKTKGQCRIVERYDEKSSMWVYDVVAPSHGENGKGKHRVLYFAGGGFQSPPSGGHWTFVANLASALVDEYAFTVVSYPLAPNSPASESLPMLRKYLRGLIDEIVEDGRGGSVSLMGDSAGGNVALSLGFWWAEELERMGVRSETEPSDRSLIPTQPSSQRSVLKNMFVISPAVDHRNTNPDIKKADPTDPLLGYDLIESVSKAWCAAPPKDPSAVSSRSDPKISPVLHSSSSYQLLRDLDIKIHGMIGTADVLAPDGELFRQKCVESDVAGEWLVWKGQMHCFVLAGAFGLSEGKAGIEWMKSVMKKNA